VVPLWLTSLSGSAPAPPESARFIDAARASMVAPASGRFTRRAVVTEGLSPCILGGPFIHDVTNADPLGLCHKRKLRYADPRISSVKGTNMIKVKRSSAIAFVVISSAATSMILWLAAAHAQVTVDITKITCRQYLIGNIVPTKTMAIWFSGYYNGKRGATMIDMSATEPNAVKVELYCGLHQDEMLIKAIEDVLGVK
jgi:acid stress chaperone HdeB